MDKSKLPFLLGLLISVSVAFLVILYISSTRDGDIQDTEENDVQQDDTEGQNTSDNHVVRVAQGLRVDISDWERYTNDEFGFTLIHPPDWVVFESSNSTFSIYDPERSDEEPPFNHHSYSVTHVSILPEGLATEGMTGLRETTSVDFQVPVDEERTLDVALADETVFGTFAQMESYPDGWNEIGYIVSVTNIENLTLRCLRDDDQITEHNDDCDMVEGERTIFAGSIDERDRSIQEVILSSFQFTDPELQS